MQITPLPKDASAGISSLLHQGHRPAVGASSLRLHHLWKWLPSTLQRTSARLSCDHMLPQPSACSQPALPPEFSLPEGCGLLRRAAAPCCCGGHRTHRPPWQPHIVQWPRRDQNLFVLPPNKDCQLLGYRKQNKTKQTKDLLPLMVHHKSWPFTSQSWPSWYHSLIHWDRRADTVLLFPWPAFPFRGFAFQWKTKQSKTKIQQAPNPSQLRWSVSHCS